MIFDQFTEAQTRAWDWIRSSVTEDMTATDALAAYRSQGGSIRTQDWYRTYNSIAGYSETWDTLNTFQKIETIPERFYLDAPRNFSKDYVAEVEVAIRNSETGELQRTFRYIESDYRKSQQEIDQALQELGQDYPQDEQWNIDYIYGYKFYKKGE